ncbi:uncharacterized protein BDW43DRAFT_318836 [Aspergillus alliaceus]|uniref:uncharacterized protein n=1 Tax=Petromyces alliaceus TaxID=209559 RepID=UPI0012A6A68E|nr:uncharacterized protein BDW43DRAFT_318836 [Aspergillus alliaceus]KAB8234546.1 hypothetical protein BDW43DRAFT_318836 [Aspergillus alliaceus]
MNCAAVEESSSDLTGEDHKDPETRSAAESQEYPTGLEFRLIVLLTLSALVALGGLDTNIFIFGELYKLFSIKRISLLAQFIFLVGSLLSVTATRSSMLVLERAVTGASFAGIIGVGGGGFHHSRSYPTSPIIESAAILAAPIVGGLLTQKLGRRCCDDNIFLFSDPKPSDTSITFRQKLVELDPLSHQVVTPALTGLFIAFSWAGTKYPWDDGKVIRPLVTFAILIVAFLYNQRRRGDAAALSPRILKSCNVITSAIFTIFVREYSPSKSDYMIVPIVIGATIRMLLCGSGTSTTGYYTPFMLFSSTLIPTFAGLITTFGVNTSFIRLLLYPGAFGFASGIGFNAPISAVQTVLPKVDVPLGPVNCGLAQHFGPAVFVAIAQDIFTSGLLTNLARVVPGLDPATIESDGLPEIILGDVGRICGETSRYLAVGLTCVTLVGSMLVE